MDKEKASPIFTKSMSDIHHEIKSPLTAILMSADYLEKTDTIEPEKKKMLLQMIKNDVKRVELLLNELKNLPYSEVNDEGLSPSKISSERP